MKISLKMYKYIFFNCNSSDKPDIERLRAGLENLQICHISGVGLRNTVMDSICSTLWHGKVHIIWQRIQKSSLLPTQPVASSQIPTRTSGSHIPFCMRIIFYSQPDQSSSPLFGLLFSFLVRDYIRDCS